MLTLFATAAHADLVPQPRPAIAPMLSADESVCDLLRAEAHDVCKQIAKADRVSVFQSGSTHGIRRVVMAIANGAQTLVSTGLDFLTEDCAANACVTLVSTSPTIRPVTLDGRPGFVLDLVATFRQAQTWQTESLVGCGATATGAWKCSTIDVGRCQASVTADGRVTTSCGGHMTLSLDS